MTGVERLKPTMLIVACVASVGLAGCSSGLLGGGGGPVAEQTIPVGNQLALPPDLALRPPGKTSPAYQANAGVGAAEQGVYADDVVAPSAPINRQAALPKGTVGDPYEKYGISKVNADGTPKSEGKLREELRQAVLAEKRRVKPGYGTVFNVGDLFKD